MTRQPTPRPDACSVQWDAGEPPLWGTAAVARFWVALEQDGPWGHTAIVESHLDPALGTALEQACSRAGGRLLLVRAVGPHPGSAGARTVLVAGGAAHDRWLVRAEIEDPAALLALPFAALTAGDVVRLLGGHTVEQPQLLVCTNGKRDVCCAVRGRALALAAAERRPGQVWECTHTGGHRFAPTGIMLPSGQTLGRLTADVAVAALDGARAGRLVSGPVHDRGLAHLDPVVQAAQAYVRHESGADRVGDVVPGAPYADGPGVCVPVHAPGRRWRVRVEREPTGAVRKDSCAKGPAPSSVWRVTTLPDPTQEITS